MCIVQVTCTYTKNIQETCTIVNMITIKLSENIKYFRKQLGLTQEQLAKKLNGKKSLISNYETGYSTPDIYVLCQLAKIFDVTLDELVDFTFSEK